MIQGQETWEEPIDVPIDCTGVPTAINISMNPFNLYNHGITILTFKLTFNVFSDTIDLIYDSTKDVFANMGIQFPLRVG